MSPFYAVLHTKLAGGIQEVSAGTEDPATEGELTVYELSFTHPETLITILVV